MATDFPMKCVNTIRLLSADQVEKANSGHPGAPMGCAPIAHTLWSKIMKYSPKNPKWANRDRFVLSNGHASALLYSMLHLTGYDLPMDHLKRFRQLNSITAGHPENILHPAIEVSTGPLGQGISNAVGMAIAQAHTAATFNKPGFDLINNHTYVLCGDGCLQEGISSEASSLAGHLGLGNLIVCYDDNHITIDGSTDLSFSENVLARYEAYGWHVQHVPNGDSDLAAIEAAIEAAKAVTDKPSLIKVTTTIGFGSSKAATAEAHGAPLGAKDIAAVRAHYGFPADTPFYIPEDVGAFYTSAGNVAHESFVAWQALFDKYSAEFPELAAEFTRRFNGDLPSGWFEALPRNSGDGKSAASRTLSGQVLNALAPMMPEIMGGSADLTPSNMTALKNIGDFQKDNFSGRYIRFGVREHAMAAICNGMASYGAILPYCATFLNFIGYALGALRLTALSHFRVIYVATHDSIGLGEDGPTHQPVEMLMALRATPNTYVYRPADLNETSAAYACALKNPLAPAILSLARQGVPPLANSSIESAMKGGYICVGDAASSQVIIAATGTEVSLAVEAAASLEKEGIKAAVASLPCLEIFEHQGADYIASVFPAGVPVVSVEASATRGWERYSHCQVGLTTFGASAPGPDVYKHFGITAENVAAKAKALVAHFNGKAPVLPVSFPKL